MRLIIDNKKRKIGEFGYNYFHGYYLVIKAKPLENECYECQVIKLNLSKWIPIQIIQKALIKWLIKL